MTTGRGVDPVGETLASASADAGLAAATLTGGGPPTRARGPQDDLIGKHFAHFRIDKPLGRGGMGEVYLATDVALDRPVALKVLRKETAADPGFRRRFIREARAQARINHPNVCHIYFIGEQDGQIFFAMELVEGETLQQRLERAGRVAPDEALELARQAALGLREANRHGFTHRDVKPSNLLVDRHGVVKVVDFGIVKEQERGDMGGTQEPAIVGTPLYMAPEQAKGDEVDHRADIYALGATLHHLVSGDPPFGGDTPMAILSRALSEPRPRLTAKPQARKAKAGRLDAIVDRMMAKKPGERFADYDALIAAFDETSAVRSRPAGFWVRSFALLVDLILVGLLAIPVGLIPGTFGDNSVFFPLLLFYQIVLIARFGRTVGKMALDLEVVDVERGRRPTWARAALRTLVQVGPTTLGASSLQILEHAGAPQEGVAEIVIVVVVAGIMLVLPTALGIAASFAVDKRAIWDKIARTRVRYKKT